MDKKEKKRVWMNRILAFLFGGLVVFAVFSFAVTAPVKSRNAALTEQLDEIRFGADRLLEEARAYIVIGSDDKAKSTLDTLFEQHPASTQAAEGAVLYSDIELRLLEGDTRWDDAVETVKAAWENTRAGEIRAQFETERLQMESTMTETLAQEWEESKDAIREEWEES